MLHIAALFIRVHFPLIKIGPLDTIAILGSWRLLLILSRRSCLRPLQVGKAVTIYLVISIININIILLNGESWKHKSTIYSKCHHQSKFASACKICIYVLFVTNINIYFMYAFLHPGKKWTPKPLSSEQVKQTIALAALTFFKISSTSNFKTLGKSILVKQKNRWKASGTREDNKST